MLIDESRCLKKYCKFRKDQNEMEFANVTFRYENSDFCKNHDKFWSAMQWQEYDENRLLWLIILSTFENGNIWKNES